MKRRDVDRFKMIGHSFPSAACLQADGMRDRISLEDLILLLQGKVFFAAPLLKVDFNISRTELIQAFFKGFNFVKSWVDRKSVV